MSTTSNGNHHLKSSNGSASYNASQEAHKFQTYTSHLECSKKCGQKYDHKQLHNLCQCGFPLLVRYDLQKLKESSVTRDSIRQRPSGMWRYRELLPVEGEALTLQEQQTPILHLKKLEKQFGFKELMMKDEGILPCGTFKARGAAVGIGKKKSKKSVLTKNKRKKKNQNRTFPFVGKKKLILLIKKHLIVNHLVFLSLMLESIFKFVEFEFFFFLFYYDLFEFCFFASFSKNIIRSYI